MEKNYILEELIHKGVAVVCYSSEDVIKLSEWVDVLCPGVGSRIRCYKNAVGSKEYGGKIAIRLENGMTRLIMDGIDLRIMKKEVLPL